MKKIFLSILFCLFSIPSYAYNIVKLNPTYIPNPSSSRALSLGKMYVGEVDTDPTVAGNQKTIYVQEEDGTITAVSQPLTIGAGGVPLYNGVPASVLVEGDYSLKILNSSGTQIYYIPSDQSLVSSYSLNNKYGCDLAAAISDIGATATHLDIDCSPTISDGETITTNANTSLNFLMGNIIYGTAGGGTETLAINGGLICPSGQQCFDITNLTVNGTPKVKFIEPNSFVENTTPGTTEMAEAIQAAINLGNGHIPVEFLGEHYKISTQIDLLDGSMLEGTGTVGTQQTNVDGTRIDCAVGGKCFSYDTGNSKWGIRFEHITINSIGAGNTHALYFKNAQSVILRDVFIGVSSTPATNYWAIAGIEFADDLSGSYNHVLDNCDIQYAVSGLLQTTGIETTTKLLGGRIKNCNYGINSTSVVNAYGVNFSSMQTAAEFGTSNYSGFAYKSSRPTTFGCRFETMKAAFLLNAHGDIFSSVGDVISSTNVDHPFMWSEDEWEADTVYSVGAIVAPTTENGYYYRIETGDNGTSDSSEPSWPTMSGSTIVDNTATWTAYRIDRNSSRIGAGGATEHSIGSEVRVPKLILVEDDNREIEFIVNNGLFSVKKADGTLTYFSFTSGGALTFPGNIFLPVGSTWIFGDGSTDGNWRFRTSGANFVIEKRESGSWNIKQTITP